MSTVRQWLAGLGLAQYAEAFEENAVGLDLLPELDHDILTSIGVVAAGHRMRILKAARDLKAPQPPIADTDATGSRASEPVLASEPERRQLTVMFCDLVGSTALSAQMDPEEYRDVLAAYQSVAKRSLDHYEGFIARYMGDGLLVYFGYPQAHEDDAERAIRGGLEIVEAVRALRPRGDLELAVRIGIATGLVVAGDIVGEGVSEERAVLGETPNLAARLQAVAEPNTVMLAPSTRRLIEGRFVLEEQAPRALKGIEGTVQAHRAIAVLGVSRFEAATARGLTSMAGRESELAILEQRWTQAKFGEGQVVLLAGEPGIGKSRIAQEFQGRIGAGGPVALHYQCSPYRVNSAFYPVVEHLERAAGFTRDDSLDGRRQKLEAFIERSLPDVDRATPLLSALMSLPQDRNLPLKMTPEKQKAETNAVLLLLLERLAVKGPVLLVFEDAHWLDPSTRELLDLIVDRVQSLPVLCLITYRLEFSPRWTSFGHVTALSLNRLGRQEVRRIVETVAGGKALPPEVLEQIVGHTDGVPLFVEELTKTVLESGLLTDTGDAYHFDGSLSAFTIPSTLRDALIARLDRLSTVKEVAQVGACIGREFSYELLATVSPVGEHELVDALSQLVDSELVFCRGEPPDASYVFKHALVQDVAYDSMLRSRRRKMHANIASALEGRFHDAVENAPELLAHHLTEADRPTKASEYWLRAGQRATERSEYREASAHLKKGLEVLDNASDVPDRAKREITLRLSLGVAVQAVEGAGNEEVGRIYRRACELDSETDDVADHFTALWGLWRHYRQGIDFKGARELVDELLRVSQLHADPALCLQAHHAQWMTSFLCGEYELARESALRGTASYDSNVHHSQARRFGGHDPFVCAQTVAGLASWTLGFPQRALTSADEALVLARKLDHPDTLALALDEAAQIHQLCGKPRVVEERAQELLALAREWGFLEYRATAEFLHGWTLAARGQVEAGAAQMRRVQDGDFHMGAEIAEPYFVCLAAETYSNVSDTEEGLDLLNEALLLTRNSGMHYWDAELIRMRGVLVLALSGTEEAEASFEHAIRTARDRRAKSLELRAATSLARLLQGRGDSTRGRAVLKPVYDWFTEGFDTADLTEARVLLEELC
jgi:class 3 adenylate cyclase/predicted ATPase